jgi:hypothetical protein
VANFIATLAPERTDNWDICKREQLWGIVGRGTNWRKNAERLRPGDRVFIWRGGRRNGFIASIVALGPVQFVGPGVRIPWPDPTWFGGVFPMRVQAELSVPESDTFPNDKGRVGQRFGFNNTVLQHIFEEIPPAVATRVAAVFPAVSVSPVGVPHTPSPPPSPGTTREPAITDPDLIGRGLVAHHVTVEQLAAWLRGHGIVPLLPAAGDPQFDLAWWIDEVLHVAEIKSVTTANEEHQLRLGLGQVLRYREHLRSIGLEVAGWLISERAPTDATWLSVASGVDVGLCWPGRWPTT